MLISRPDSSAPMPVHAATADKPPADTAAFTDDGASAALGPTGLTNPRVRERTNCVSNFIPIGFQYRPEF